MKKAPLSALLGMAALLAFSDSGAVEPAAPLDPEIWVLGDSIGVGIEGALLRRKMPIRRTSITGANARQWLRTLRDPSQHAWPAGRRFVVVSLGTNDAQSAELRRQFNANALAIVEELHKRGHVVCWVLPSSEASLIPQPVDIERLTALGIAVLWERVAMSDQWHPSAAGYDQLAAAILKAKAPRT